LDKGTDRNESAPTTGSLNRARPDLTTSRGSSPSSSSMLISDPREGPAIFVDYYAATIAGYAEQAGALTGLSLPVLIGGAAVLLYLLKRR